MKIIILLFCILPLCFTEDLHYKFNFKVEDDGQHERSEVSEKETIKGSYSYVDANGNTRTVNYVADKNGFRPSGDISVDQQTLQASQELVEQLPKSPENIYKSSFIMGSENFENQKTIKIQNRPVQNKPFQNKPFQNKQIQNKPIQSKPIQSKPIQSKPSQSKPIQSKPSQSKPNQSKSSQSKPIQNKQITNQQTTNQQTTNQQTNNQQVKPKSKKIDSNKNLRKNLRPSNNKEQNNDQVFF